MPAAKREKNGRYPKGENGGAHGVKGRSGRKATHFKEWCRELTDDADAREMYATRNKSGDLDVMKFAASYAYGKPTETQKVEQSGRIEIVFVKRGRS